MTDTDERPNGHLPTDRLTALIAQHLDGAYLDVTSEDSPRIAAAALVPGSVDTIAVTFESHPPLDEWASGKRVEHRELRLSPVQLPEEQPVEAEADEPAEDEEPEPVVAAEPEAAVA